MDFRIRQLKRALEPLRGALESHHRSLEGLESALIEFVERKRDWHGRFGAYVYRVLHIAAVASSEQEESWEGESWGQG